MVKFAYQLQNVNIDKLKQSKYDLLVIDNEHTKEEIAKLAPKKVIAYISIGEAEDYRSYWKKTWKKSPPVWLGKENKEWKGNYTVKQFWHEEWWTAIQSMLDKIIAKGYAGIAMDKVDVFDDLGGSDEMKEHAIKLVCRISAYCKSKKPKFMIIAHNAAELLRDEQYLKAIDGITQEDLVYDWNSDGQTGKLTDPTWRKTVCGDLERAATKGKEVLILEYVSGLYWKKASKFIQDYGYSGYSAPRDLGSLRNV